MKDPWHMSENQHKFWAGVLMFVVYMIAGAIFLRGMCGCTSDPTGSCMQTTGCEPTNDAGQQTVDTRPTDGGNTMSDGTMPTDGCLNYYWITARPWNCMGGTSFDCNFQLNPAGNTCQINCPGGFGGPLNQFTIDQNSSYLRWQNGEGGDVTCYQHA